MMQAALACAAAYSLIYFVDVYLLSWQCLIRPIVAAPIIGLLMGDPMTGIVMGASLEGIFMGISAVGGTIPSDPFSATIIAVAYAILSGGASAMETGLALAVTIGALLGPVQGMTAALWGAFAPYWEHLAAECKPKKFLWMNIGFSFIQTLPVALIIFLSIAFGVETVQAGLAACPAWVMTGLSTAGSMMTAVGFGILLSMIWSADIAVFYFVGFVLCKSLGLSSLGIAVIAAGIALLYFFIEKDIIAARGKAADDESEPVSAAAKPANTEEDFF